MNYVALYRKYRPQTFDDVIGQDHIINTLRNQILKDKISHAYLFTGTRGTGKTSTAKIFARAVNCPNAKKHNGNPCEECSVCEALRGVNMDIIEMDAASNNGVDYARDIREKVQYPPVNGKYKVYIIDEVHMLSVGAFNALLKTLEEPPEHALFILCTTEVHKIPATILSRCMRFDFRLVSLDKLTEHVCKIYDSEGKLYTKEAVAAIAQAGEGSVRDTVSIADRCFSVGEGRLTYEQVMSVLGVSSRESIAELANAILKNSTGEILSETDSLVRQGKDVGRIAKDLSLFMRDLLTVKLCKNAQEMLCLPQNEFDRLQATAQSATEKKLLYAINVLAELEINLRYAISPLMLFEASALKIAGNSGEVDVDSLERRLARVEQLQNDRPFSNLVVDKTNAQSIWMGVKNTLEERANPLLLGVWKDVSVKFSEEKFVVMCHKGSFMLIQAQFKQDLLNEIKKYCNKPVEFVQVDEPTDSEINRQLKDLSGNVRFDGNGRK